MRWFKKLKAKIIDWWHYPEESINLMCELQDLIRKLRFDYELMSKNMERSLEILQERLDNLEQLQHGCSRQREFESPRED